MNTNVLYHASPINLDKLVPKNIHGDNDIVDAIFATPNKAFALSYLNKWSDKDIAQTTIDGKVHLMETYPSAFKKIFKEPGYLYTLPGESFRNIRNSPNELISTEIVVPIKKERIKNLIEYLKKEPNIVLEKFNLNNPLFIEHINSAIDRANKMSKEKQQQYLKWRLAGANKHIKEMFKKQIKIAVEIAQVGQLGGYGGATSLGTSLLQPQFQQDRYTAQEFEMNKLQRRDIPNISIPNPGVPPQIKSKSNPNSIVINKDNSTSTKNKVYKTENGQ